MAHEADQYLGHVRLIWQPDYPLFRNADVPEIQYLNVIPKYQKCGIGAALITALASERSNALGIGLGLCPEYSDAQRLYSKLGYRLDGNGVHNGNAPIEMRQTHRLDDDLVICSTKRMTPNNLL